MIKVFACGALALLVAGCAGTAQRGAKGSRPDWADGASASYPRDKYLTGSASADDPESAKDRARAEIAKVFSTKITAGNYSSASEYSSSSPDKKIAYSAQDASQSVKAVSEKQIEGVEIAAAWRDPADGRYYALAVLERRKALASLQSKLAALDARASELASAIAAGPDAMAKAKPALKLIALLKDRETLVGDIRTAGQGAAPAASFDTNAARRSAAEALAALGVTLVVAPEGLDRVSAEIAKSLNALGFQVSDGKTPADIAVSCAASFEPVADPDPKSRWKWQRGSAAVTMKEAKTDRTFLSFNATAKEAAATPEEAGQKAETSLGRRIGEGIAKGLDTYFENQ